jgi:hypothetical protein
MGQVTHNLSNPNDGFGDALRDAFDNQNAMNTELYDTKVDEISGKGLSENDFTNALKDKLVNIDTDAQINVQADWFQEDDTQDDFIKNKPDYLNAIGSFLYADLTTQTTPLNGIANVEKNLTNDIDGTGTDLSNAPYGVSTLWDSANSKLDFSQLSIGDVVDLRCFLSVTTTVSNQNIQVYARVGIGTPSEKDFLIGSVLRTTAGLFIFEEELKLVISKEDYITAIGEIYLFSESNSTIKVNEFEFVVTRKNVNITAFTGLTDLSATRTPTNVTIESSTGTPALIGLGNGTNAGFSLNDYTSAEKAKLADTYIKSEVDGFVNSKANDNAVVHLLGNETISGIKTFLTGMLGLQNVANTFTSFFLNTNTLARTYTLQDKTGTLAHLDDVSNSSHWTKTVNNIANNNSGNVGIGTGATAPSSKLTVFGDVDFKNSLGVSKFSFNTTTSQLNLGAGTLIVGQLSGSGSGTNIVFDSSNNYYSFDILVPSSFVTAKNIIGFTETFNLTSGSATVNLFSLNPTINQTGTSTSLIRGIYINPTLTSDVGGFRAIEVTAGKSIFQEVILQKPLKLAQYTVATLPTGTQGDEAYVTDALTPTYLGTAVGGGAVVCKVFFNGTNWIT